MLRSTLQMLRDVRDYAELPSVLKDARRRDRREGIGPDPGIPWAVTEGLAWIGRAQDSSASADGGVARHFGLREGWSASYPETTGYIIPTMLEQATLRADEGLRARARRMLTWLVGIQLTDGGFQGGMIGQTPVVPVTFNTGQILFGLVGGVSVFGDEYRMPMRAAATWLANTQDADGCWRKFATPFAAAGEKAYETHVSWALLEAERIEPGHGYADAALRNVRWALTHQRANGWFDRSCLDDVTQPYTHAIGYALRGVMEAYRFGRDETFLAAGRRTADGLLTAMREDGALPGRIDANWRGTVAWSCLTGNVQIAHSFLMLYQDTGDKRYRDTAYRLNEYVRRTLRPADPPETRGAVKGSFPVDGGYCTYEFPNWATKFAIDSYTIEQQVRRGEATA